jgi:hypothetical protein
MLYQQTSVGLGYGWLYSSRRLALLRSAVVPAKLGGAFWPATSAADYGVACLAEGSARPLDTEVRVRAGVRPSGPRGFRRALSRTFLP